MDAQKVLVSCSVISISIIAGLGLWYFRKVKRVSQPNKWIPMGKVSDLLIYPLKSGYRISVNEVECTECGFKQITEKAVYKLQDRFLVTYKDEDNEFRTGRTHPKLILITVSNYDQEHVAFDAPGMRTLYVQMPNVSDNSVLKKLKYRKESIDMIDCGDEAASWLSRFVLEKESGLRLGFHDENLKQRYVNDKNLKKFYPHLSDSDLGLFTDLSSYMLINQSSVNDMNSKITSDIPVTSHQFRPNIIIENAVAYAEDKWKWIKIGNEAIFYNVKPCTRCVFITINPETADRSKQREPLKTLEKYRQLQDPDEREANHNAPVMGVNLGLRKPGVIKQGDIVYVGVR